MSIVDSSFLSTSESILRRTHNIQVKQSSRSNNETMPIIADVESINLMKSKKHLNSKRTSLITYGPIRVRKRHTTAPTLATGRRSKDDLIEGEDAIKREIRRMKNRESARNLKRLRDNIEHGLEIEVDKLEFEERNLLTHVNALQLYKQYLQEQCRQTKSVYDIISRTASAVLSEIKRQQILQDVPVHNELKQEPRSPSPQWQLLFHI